MFRLPRAWKCCWARLDKPPIIQPFKIFPVLYGTRRFTAVFIRVIHWGLCWARSAHFISPLLTSLRPYVILPTTYALDFLITSFHVTFLLIFHLHSPFQSCYIRRSSLPPWFNHCNYICRRVQFVNPPVMLFSPTFHHNTFRTLRC